MSHGAEVTQQGHTQSQNSTEPDPCCDCLLAYASLACNFLLALKVTTSTTRVWQDIASLTRHYHAGA